MTVDRDVLLREQAEYAITAQRLALGKVVAGTLNHLADDPDCDDLLRLAALTEELGEVARCLHDEELIQLHGELAHLAGIALAWMIIAE